MRSLYGRLMWRWILFYFFVRLFFFIFFLHAIETLRNMSVYQRTRKTESPKKKVISLYHKSNDKEIAWKRRSDLNESRLLLSVLHQKNRLDYYHWGSSRLSFSLFSLCFFFRKIFLSMRSKAKQNVDERQESFNFHVAKRHNKLLATEAK